MNSTARCRALAPGPVVREAHGRGPVEVGKGREAASARDNLDQDLLTFAVEFGGEQADPGCVAAVASHRADQSRPDHILGNPENRDRRRRLLHGTNSNIPANQNDIDPCFDELRRNFGKLFDAQSKSTRVDRQVLALDEAQPPKLVKKRNKKRRIAWTGEQAAEMINSSRLLKAGAACGTSNAAPPSRAMKFRRFIRSTSSAWDDQRRGEIFTFSRVQWKHRLGAARARAWRRSDWHLLDHSALSRRNLKPEGFPGILEFCNTLVGRTPFALKTWGAGFPIYSSMRRCPV